MATLHLHPPPPRTPSPKIRIHRSQSFDSPSSRVSVTPIDESPYSKSTSALQHAVPLALQSLPRRDILSSMSSQKTKANAGGRAINGGVILHTAWDTNEDPASSSEDSEMDIDSDFLSSSDSEPASPTELTPFHHRPQLQRAQLNTNTPAILPSPSNTISIHLPQPQPSNTAVLSYQPLPYQDPTSLSTMHSPYLVRLVLDLYDVRGLAWTDIAEPITRVWGIATSSAEVLGILCGNGRVGGVVWWD